MKVFSFEKQISIYAILGFICFISIYPLDGIKVLTDKFIYLPPFGFIGLVLSLFLIVPFFSIKRVFFVNIWIVIFYSLVLGLIVLTLSSQYFEWLDLWTYFKLFITAPIIGCFTAIYLKSKKVTNNLLYIILLLLLILSFAVLYFYFNRNLFLDINYLSSSESILLTSIFLIVYLPSTKNKLIITVITLGLLFMSDSRFVFFSFLLISFIYFSLSSIQIMFKLFFLLLVLFFFIIVYEPGLLLESRFARLLLHSSSDTSLGARSELSSEGFFITEFYSISGKYAYYRDNCNGCYAHNFLSLWFEFGVIGICFIIFLLSSFFAGIITSFKIILSKCLNSKFEMIYFLLTIHVLMGFVLSKHWSFFTLFFVLGMTFNLLNKKGFSLSKTYKY